MLSKDDVVVCAANYMRCAPDQLEIELKNYCAFTAPFNSSECLSNSRYKLEEDELVKANDRELFFILGEHCTPGLCGFYGWNSKPFHQETFKIDTTSVGFFCKVIGFACLDSYNNITGQNGQIIYYHIKRK